MPEHFRTYLGPERQPSTKLPHWISTESPTHLKVRDQHLRKKRGCGIQYISDNQFRARPAGASAGFKYPSSQKSCPVSSNHPHHERSPLKSSPTVLCAERPVVWSSEKILLRNTSATSLIQAACCISKKGKSEGLRRLRPGGKQLTGIHGHPTRSGSRSLAPGDRSPSQQQAGTWMSAFAFVPSTTTAFARSLTSTRSAICCAVYPGITWLRSLSRPMQTSRSCSR